jgi:PLAT/LH2 domain-containing protein
MTTTYRITVKTGTPDNAGTDAHVYTTMFGSNGTSGERELENYADNFENGKIDTFSVTMQDIGVIRRVRIRHDNTGSNPGWFLDGIRIHNESNDGEWFFPCNRWLSIGNDDGQIERLLDAA